MICGIRLLRVLSLLPSDCRRHKGCWSRSQERILMCALLRNRNSMTIHPKSARTILKVRQGGGRAGAAGPGPRALTEVAKHSPTSGENRDSSPASPFLG
jgi:hypothetical protein